MPIGIRVRDTDDNDIGIGFNLDHEIIDYFQKLKGYPWLKQLVDLDPYDDTCIHQDWIKGLCDETVVFLLQIRNKRWRIPPPPTRVSTDGSSQPDAGIPFNERELDRLISKMNSVLQQGLIGGNTVWAEGD